MQQNPFSLPEIFHNIRQFLNQKDVIQCIRASKFWYNALLPFIWETIDFSQEHCFPADAAILEKHAHLVLAITLDSNSPAYAHKTVYPHLRDVYICACEPPTTFPIDIFNHPTIQKIEINDKVKFPIGINIWEVTSHFKSLRELSMRSQDVTPDTVQAFWTTLGRVRKVSLYRTNLPDNLVTDPSTPQRLENMTFLSLMGGYDEQLQLEVVRKATNLEYLFWPVFSLDFQIVECFAQKIFMRLHDISLYRVELSNLQVQLILNSITKLTALHFENVMWGDESFLALSRHFGTLERLNQNLTSFTSKMLNTVLCSCPELLSLDGIMINASDIVNNTQIIDNEGPCDGWICTKLVFLTLGFNIDTDSQIPVLKNLARLTELVYLDMDNIINNQYSDRFLTLSLKDGLDILKSLKSLTNIKINYHSQTMTMADIDWIVGNWRSLKSFDGEPHYNSVLNLYLKEYMEKLGIKTNK